MAEEKGKFSYTSPKVQQRNALKAFGVQFIVIIVVIIGAFVALNYFGIFPIGKLFPKFFSNLPTTADNQNKEINNNPTAQISPTPFKYDKNSSPSLEVGSEAAGYTVLLQDRDKLMQIMDSWGLFDKEYSSRYGTTGSTLGYPLKKVIIHLTNVRQTSNFFGSDKNPYSSSFTKISPGQFDMAIHIDSSVLGGKQTNLDPSKVLQTSFFISLYHITHPAKSVEEGKQLNKEMFQQFQDNPLFKQSYFVIEKK